VKTVVYWALTFAMIATGGVLAIIEGVDPSKPLIAINIGMSAPLILRGHAERPASGDTCGAAAHHRLHRPAVNREGAGRPGRLHPVEVVAWGAEDTLALRYGARELATVVARALVQ
jgi:hypothetical protein